MYVPGVTWRGSSTWAVPAPLVIAVPVTVPRRNVIVLPCVAGESVAVAVTTLPYGAVGLVSASDVALTGGVSQAP